MKKEEKFNYKIDNYVLKNYVEAINSIKKTMSKINGELNRLSKVLDKSPNESTKPMQINIMSNAIKELSVKYLNEQAKIFTDTIK